MKLFWVILKYAGVLIGSGTFLFGVFSYFDGLSDDISEVKDTVEYINVEQAFMVEDISDIRDALAALDEKRKKQGQDIETLTWGLHHINDFDAEQFEEIMEELLNKNFSHDPPPTPVYVIPRATTGFESITEHTGEKLNSFQ